MQLPLWLLWAAAHGSFRALRFRSRWIDASGRRIHLYERQGSGKGPLLLLVHGLGGASFSFLPVLRRLLPVSRRVVAVDLPGHGRSLPGIGEEPATILQCAEALGALVRGLGEPAVLIGNSLGGALSLYTAASLPEHVRGVVGLNPAGAPLVGADRDVVVQAFRGGNRAAVLDLMSRLYVRPSPTHRWFADGFARHFASPVVQQLVSEIRGDEPGVDPALLARIRAKVLILWGEGDRLLPASSVAWFRQQLPSAQVEVVPGSGHLPMIEASRLVGDRIARFVAELR